MPLPSFPGHWHAIGLSRRELVQVGYSGLLGLTEELRPYPGLTVETLANRRKLLEDLDRQRAELTSLAELRQFSQLQDEAVAFLTSGKLAKAFSLDREPPQLRDKYGRHLFGQSLLLARRLLQAGVPLVQANMGAMNTWDTHTNNCKRLKGSLLPPLDAGVAALLDDLEAQGMLEQTLVVMLGEFGRTPRLGTDNGGNITSADGRDHWAGVFFAFFAGGGVRGGQVIGKSDKIAAFPASRAYYPSDLGATIYSALGIDPGVEVRDRLDRPMRLNAGEVIQPLFSGASA